MTIGFPLDPVPSAAMPPRGRGRAGLAVVLALVLAGSAAGGVMAWRAWGGASSARAGAVDGASLDSLAHAPAGVRVRVHVTNASGVRGQGRRAMARLRAQGFDVVGIDSERGAGRDVTEVVVLAGPRAWAERVRRALGVGTVGVRPDSTRYLDVLVRLGRDWQPPAEALRP